MPDIQSWKWKMVPKMLRHKGWKWCLLFSYWFFCFFRQNDFIFSLIFIFLTDIYFSHGMHGDHGNYSFGVFFLPQITLITLINISYFDSLFDFVKNRSADLHRFFTRCASFVYLGDFFSRFFFSRNARNTQKTTRFACRCHAVLGF